jgi:predicted negative regulator of RcsB-dependent stress response
MPQALIVIFLLFFAVLAFGWFYWQRAKARDAGTTTASASTTDSAEATSTDQS